MCEQMGTILNMCWQVIEGKKCYLIWEKKCIQSDEARFVGNTHSSIALREKKPADMPTAHLWVQRRADPRKQRIVHRSGKTPAGPAGLVGRTLLSDHVAMEGTDLSQIGPPDALGKK